MAINEQRDHLVNSDSTYYNVVMTTQRDACEATFGEPAHRPVQTELIDSTLALGEYRFVPVFDVRGLTQYQVQDALGNKVTPLVSVGEAYYRRKMPTYVYDIYDGASQCHNQY